MLALAILLLVTHRFLPIHLHRYMVFVIAYQALPQQLASAAWWRYVWLPLDIVMFAFAVCVCRELFRLETRGRTFWWERRNVLSAAACVGLSLALVSWSWSPDNVFQAWTMLRQYIRLALASGWIMLSVWFAWIRPLDPIEVDSLSLMWCVWLVCQFAMSTAGANGIAWHVLPRTDAWYRAIGDVGMSAQIAAILWFGLKETKHERQHARHA